jgi:8-oxo-dGTP pyrophosphatase MutT (NUDIX family)
MLLQIIHSPEPTPDELTKSVFLAGPSPRRADDPNWRPAAVEALRQAGFDGTVFLPIPRDGKWPEDYSVQVEWERRHLALADVIALWCPRDLERLPGFTTNVEFGEWLHSGKLLYGRPEGAPSTRYLDARYSDVSRQLKPPFNAPCNSLEQLAQQCVDRLGEGAVRRGGERSVPLTVWRTPQFQAWYREVVAAGNRLDDAQVLWMFHIPQANNFLFCFALRVKVWVTAEERHKDNEFILSRSDISAICAYYPDPRSHELLDTKVVLIREFRSPARTADGYLHDLPGGSTFRPQENPLQVASKELKEETGVEVPPDRFRSVAARQLAGTFGTHKGHLFAVELTADELRHMEELEQRGTSFGVAAETERTYVEVRTLRQVLKEELVDHASVGMIVQACLGRWMQGLSPAARMQRAPR